VSPHHEYGRGVDPKWIRLDVNRWVEGGFVIRPCQGAQACAGARPVFSNRGGVFHEVLALQNGGERRPISAAVSRSTIIIGPPHWGQDHRERGVEGSPVEWPSSSAGSSFGTAGNSVGNSRN